MFNALLSKAYSKFILLKVFPICCLIMSAQTIFAQSSIKEIYIVDSIPIHDDPEYGDELTTDEILDMKIITNKDSLRRAGYPEHDRVSYIFTKAYRSRPDSLKSIPTTKHMIRENGLWTLKGRVYSGRFIDYYLSGLKSGEGVLKEGLLDGTRIMYHPNGNMLQEYHYTKGILNGKAEKYYADGSLIHIGEFLSGKEHGLWQMYYPNKQLKQSLTFTQGVPEGEVRMYRSNGHLITVQQFKDGKVVPEQRMEKLNAFMNSGHKNAGNATVAIRYYTKAIQTDSNYAEAYFSWGTSKLNLFDFDGAISDLDKALELEPYMEFAYANRAFARIRKYQFKNSRPLTSNKAVTVFAESQKIDYPLGEKANILKDLETAYFLGDKNEKVIEALQEFSAKGTEN